MKPKSIPILPFCLSIPFCSYLSIYLSVLQFVHLFEKILHILTGDELLLLSQISNATFIDTEARDQDNSHAKIICIGLLLRPWNSTETRKILQYNKKKKTEVFMDLESKQKYNISVCSINKEFNRIMIDIQVLIKKDSWYSVQAAWTWVSSG